MSRLASFRLKTDIAVGQYSAVVRELIFGQRLPLLFTDYLIALHQIIRANDHLMLVAAGEARRRLQQGDASCRGLEEYYLLHQQEETQHAQWLLEDIEAMKVSRQAVLSRMPPAEIAALSGCQYYWLYHHHPGLLFGYMVVLECYPMQLSDIELFRQQTGFPAQAFRTMRVHAELDSGHAHDLLHFLEHCGFSDAVFDGLATSAITTCVHLARIFKSLADRPALSCRA